MKFDVTLMIFRLSFNFNNGVKTTTTLRYCIFLLNYDEEFKCFLLISFDYNKKKNVNILTSLLGTQMGVPSLTIPASTMTPITMGSRELKIN